MTSEIQNSNVKSQNRTFDLEKRTGDFGAEIIILCRSIKLDDITRPVINQLIRSATSIGANYMEANGADSRKDFKAKISICKKESKETTHWLNMLVVALPHYTDRIKSYSKEALELSLIFSAICRKL